MNNNKSAHDIAKQMIIDGESFDKIKEVTNLSYVKTLQLNITAKNENNSFALAA